MLHTCRWPHDEVSFAGERVGLIGTGSSGIKATPEIAKQAEDLYGFQRTANWSVPARNTAIEAAQVTAVKSDYQGFRAQQRKLGAACHLPPNKQSALTIEAPFRW